jgi:hypothetical protein
MTLLGLEIDSILGFMLRFSSLSLTAHTVASELKFH